MKKTITNLVFLLLLAFLFILPFGGRWLIFHRGGYAAPEIATLDVDDIIAAPPEYNPYQDVALAEGGRVVIDMDHRNNLRIDDLTPLRDRLAARGAVVEVHEGTGKLADALRGASAYVVLAPTYIFTPVEQTALLDFVADGGRVLLVADPTRTATIIEPQYQDLYSALFPESAVPAANSLAELFGVTYYNDYLYNLVVNEGNYRNVGFSTFPEDNALTDGLDKVVFFAAHSLKTESPPLILGDDDTLSPIRTGETGLTPAVLAGEGRFLALGDLTFLIAPYNTIADNDRFMSNIADWLATDTRDWSLTEFPYLYEKPVDLSQIAGEVIDPRLVVRMDNLQALFAQAGLSLRLTDQADPSHDALLVGTYSDLESVEGYLETADVAIELNEGTVHVAGLGALELEGITLFIVDRSGDQIVVLALAEDGETAIEALERLLYDDFGGCVETGAVMLCSTGKAPTGGLDTDTDDGNGGTGGAGGSIFILSDDDGSGGGRNSAAELSLILGASYDVTIWSTSLDGIPTENDLIGYDLHIYDSGDSVIDFINNEDDFNTILSMLLVEGPIMFMGSQSFPMGNTAALSDLEVTDAFHPLGAGLGSGAVISLSPSQSGAPAYIFDESLFAGFDADIGLILSRGPSSPQSGVPVVVAIHDNVVDQRLVIALVALYRFPEDMQSLLALNAVAWLLGG